MKQYYIIFRFSLLAMLLWPHSGDTQILSLPQILDSAKVNDPRLAELSNQQKIASFENEIVMAHYKKPKVDVNAQWLEAPVIKGVGYDPAITNGGNYSAVTGITYPLLTKDFIQTERQGNNLQIEKAEWQYKASWRQIRRAVTDKYLQCYADQRYIDIARQQAGIIQEQLNVAETLARQGMIKGSDVLLLRVESDDLHRNISYLTAQLYQHLRELYALTGMADDGIKALSEPAISLTDTMAAHSNYQQQFYIDSLLTENQLDQFNLKYKPQVSAFADAGLNAVSLHHPQNDLGVSFGLNFSLNLFDGHQKEIRTAQTKIKQQTITSHRTYFSNQREQELANFLEQRQAAEQQLQELNQQLQDYELVLALYKKEITQGDVSVNDYLVTFKNYVALQHQLINQQQLKNSATNAYNYWNW